MNMERLMRFLLGAIFVSAALLVLVAARSAHAAPESAYRDWWCAEHGGEAEVRLSDATRADCITETHAVEVDHIENWAEPAGQARHYARMTGLRPGLVLIVDDTAGAWRYVPRLIHAIGESMRVWIVTEEDLP